MTNQTIINNKNNQVPTCIAVLGATGAQGGAVAKALSDKGVKVVAITRNPDSDKAKALKEREGTIVRKADLNDVDSLVAAFDGCDGAYIMANYWEDMSGQTEFNQYKNAADALKKHGATMKHVVFSTFEETTIDGLTDDFQTLQEVDGKPSVAPHCDSKGRAKKLFDSSPTTYMPASCYIENFSTVFAMYK